MGDAGHSDGAGGSSLPGGGPAALGVGDTGLGRRVGPSDRAQEINATTCHTVAARPEAMAFRYPSTSALSAS